MKEDIKLLLNVLWTLVGLVWIPAGMGYFLWHFLPGELFSKILSVVSVIAYYIFMLHSTKNYKNEVK